MTMLRYCLAATSLAVFTTTAVAQYMPGQRVDASFIMSEAGWQSNCVFVSGPHPENNGYNLVRCGDTTGWTNTRWIRANTAATTAPVEATSPASRSTSAQPGARPVAPLPAQPSLALNAGAVAPSGKPCAAGSWADCTPAGSAPSTAGHLPNGSYPCFLAGRASTMLMRITSASTYTDNGGDPGTYSFDPASQKITFTSGSLKGKNSKFLAGNKIGLTDNAENFYPTTCDLR